MDGGNNMKIIEKAFEARNNAYAPYSKYRVGACIETKDGRFYTGANIENASYGLTNCAERSAIFSAYSDGCRKYNIKAIAIVSKSDKLITPCGACRQVLAELIPKDAEIILSNGEETVITDIESLLPMSFNSENIK